MVYTKTTWGNNQPPPMNANNLNKMEQGIYDAHVFEALQFDDYPGTTQEYTFDEEGTLTKIEHKTGNTVKRTDTFTYEDDSITEVRTLSSGENITIETDLETLETTVTYATS